ncbi:MAG: DUF5615 family PIN-like protein [Bacteroidia bacterium]|nr:DUF5615 family PIN-like protein [Bacteroidia bacterium]
MKILLDTCVWGGAKKELEIAGYNVIWVGDWEVDPGDDEILAYAYKEERILITIDKDFGELAIVKGASHCGILRLVNFSSKKQGSICLHILNSHGKDLQKGALITAQPGLIRIRLSEKKSKT